MSMTESVQQKINQIREMVRKLSMEVVDLRERKALLETQLNEVQAENVRLISEVESKEEALRTSEAAMTTLSEQNNHDSKNSTSNKEFEIDELVREIEYCIGQLKK